MDMKGLSPIDKKNMIKQSASWSKDKFTNESLNALEQVLSSNSEGGGKITKKEQKGLQRYFSSSFIKDIAGPDGTTAIFYRGSAVIEDAVGTMETRKKYVHSEIRKGNTDLYGLILAVVKSGARPSYRFLLNEAYKTMHKLGGEGAHADKDTVRTRAIETLQKFAEKGYVFAIDELADICNSRFSKYPKAQLAAFTILKRLAESGNEYAMQMIRMKIMAGASNREVINEALEFTKIIDKNTKTQTD
jgi:hypothetical protein